MKSFINRPEDVVPEAIEGLVASVPHLNRLDGFPSCKVVYNLNHDGDKTVAVISGGGSGHEPFAGGYVGDGLLAAAIAGDVFAAPPEDAVLAAIRQVTGKAGCLLVFNNYTGDRLTFGAAAERAKAEGLTVDIVVIADDCALPDKPVVGRRGIGGCVLVLKVAGAAAAAGKSLEETRALAEKAVASVGTMACALTTANLPGHKNEHSSRLGENEMEMGMGLHGEPGASREALRPIDGIVADLVDRVGGRTTSSSPSSPITPFLRVDPGERVALLVNNLGGSTVLEISVATRAAVRAVTQGLGAALERVFVGPLVTSLDMKGLSVSLMKLGGAGEEELTAALDAPTSAPAWTRHGGVYVADKVPAPIPSGPATGTAQSFAAVEGGEPKLDAAAAAKAGQCIEAACRALEAAQAELDALDAKVGDGDCGSTLARGAAAVRAALPSFPLESPAAVAFVIANNVGTNIGGSSGAIFKIFFTAAASELRGQKQLSYGGALAAGAAAVSKYGGASAGDRTMLDALFPAAEALQAGSDAAAAAAAAAAGAEATKEMVAHAGRSVYVPEAAVKGVADPGAVAVARWLGAVAEVLK